LEVYSDIAIEELAGHSVKKYQRKINRYSINVKVCTRFDLPLPQNSYFIYSQTGENTVWPHLLHRLAGCLGSKPPRLPPLGPRRFLTQQIPGFLNIA